MSSNILNRALTRRQFIKTAAGTAALVTLSDRILPGKRTLSPNMALAAAPKEDGWYPGVCKMCVQGDCLQRVHVVDGVVVQVEGETRNPLNKGALCVRGQASVMQMYNPWRVKAPLKRTNPKKALNEDPKWVEISWDEAIQTVADRFKKIRADDPRKMLMVTGQGFNSMMFTPFLWAWGAPENDIPARGAACAYHWPSTYVHGESPDAIMDIDRSEYIISIGRSIGPNYCIASGASRAFLNAIDRGCRIITVDPRCSQEASKDEWVPIKPGTDQAFLLGMLNSILYEVKVMDVWSVKNRTNGPYLIGPDGEYVRDTASKKPLMWDEVDKKAKPFDGMPSMNAALEGTFDVNGVKATPALQLIKNAMKDYTPEWAEKISTVPAATIRKLAREFVDHAKIGSTITIDGFVFPFRPVGIQYERGAFQHVIEGPFGDLVGKIICALVGCLEVPGGVTGNKFPGATTAIDPDEDGVVKLRGEALGADKVWKWPVTAVDSRTFYPMSHTLVQLMLKGIVDPKTYHLPIETEALVTWCGNPLQSCFDIKTMEAAYARVPFHVANVLTYNAAAVMADIVFADQAFMEKDHWQPLQGTQQHRVATEDNRAYRLFHWRDASKIQKVYNARSGDEVLIDVAEKAGFLYGKAGLVDYINQRAVPVAPQGENLLDLTKKPTMRQISLAFLKQAFDPNRTLESVNDESGPVWKYETRGAKNHNYFYWPDNKTRHPIYIVRLPQVAKLLKENMAKAGLTNVPNWTDMDHYWAAYKAIPVWTPCPEYDAPPEYDVWALNWKTQPHPYRTGDVTSNVWIHEVMTNFNPYEYAVWLNVETARKKGLKDGDIVVVESRYGKTKGRLKVTNLIHPAAVGVPGIAGFGSSQENPIVSEGPYFNNLCSIDEKFAQIDPIAGAIEEGPACKVYKA